MIRINVLYDEENEVLSIALPQVEIEADRKNKTLTYREHSEGEVTEHCRSLGSVMFADVVNLIANNVKEYIR